MQNHSQSYRKTQINTTDRGQIVIMLYDAALRFLTKAKIKILEKDIAEKGLLISKAIDIINELDSSLNMEAGQSLATNLHNLYFLCISRLLMANLKLDVDILDSVIKILEGLRSAFAEASQTEEAKEALRSMGPHRQISSFNSAPVPTPDQNQNLANGTVLSKKMAAYNKFTSTSSTL